uniref:non-specific serine/threonine protein kinase n=1 Tax=Oryza punctata TaxID=4537 RepID=A0A0E0MKQ8_ORYPU
MPPSSKRAAAHHLASLLTVLHSLVQVQATTTLADRTISSVPVPLVACLPDQASALLRLKSSFNTTAGGYSTAFRSWVAGTDCCRWEGIHCGDADGRVTKLDLGGHDLQADIVDTALFRLTSLKHLDLSGNNFSMSQLPVTGFEQLTKLTHLDLSDTNIAGEVPSGIGHLMNLVYLDFSTSFYFVYYDDENIIMENALGSFWQLKAPNVETLLINLTNLEELHLGMVDMSKNGEQWCDGIAKSTPKLQVLSLPWCSLSGPICASFSVMRSLTTIELQYNHLSGSVPDFLAGFSNLTVLQLTRNNFEGWFPPIIFQHKKLKTINITQNPSMSGNLPNFSQDSRLENLFLSRTNFTGQIPSSISNLKSLRQLDLGASGFSGMLPSSLGSLKYLDLLKVSGLQLVGSIPSWISNLTSLTALQFSNCGLSGQVPSSIGNLRKLTKLALYKCNFSGKVPPQILNLTQLQTLQLHSNNFAGMIELTSFSKLKNLFVLNLSNNKVLVLDGENSSSLVPFPKIELLSLASCRISTFPNILRHLHEITSLDLSYNQIQGAIPQWAWETWKGMYFLLLNISHNNITSLGSDPLLRLQIEFFDLSFNSIEGPIPIPQGGSTMLDYSNNQFSSMPLNCSTYLGETLTFKATKNKLSGNIPSSICTAVRRLQLIDLSYNNLSGSIPFCLTEDVSALQVLSLQENKLVGTLPDNIKEGCALEAINLSGNLIEGKIPRSLVACKNLEILDIGSNQISDSFPCWMSKFPKLQVLVLKSNKFTGQVMDPSDENSCEFTELRIADMASNNFNGTLPEIWFKMLKSMMAISDNDTLVMENKYYHGQTYQFTATVTYKGNYMTISKILRTLMLIDFSNNAFHGTIPQTIGGLVLLHGLNMSHNALTGSIPTQFGRLNQLESLDLSSNELSGEIPKELASLNFLSTLNLSDNMLVGRIPDSYQFSTFSNGSFLGNTGLCGPPLSKQCDDPEEPIVMPHDSEKSIDVVLVFFTALGFGVSFATTILIVWRTRAKQTQIIMSSSSMRVAHHLPSLLTVLHVLLQAQATTTLADRTSSSVPPPIPCLPDQASALLRLKGSFTDGRRRLLHRLSVMGRRCRLLQLGGRPLRRRRRPCHLPRPGRPEPASRQRRLCTVQVNLTSAPQPLRHQFQQLLPFAGFDQLTELTHLDLSDTNIAGKVPVSIGRLTNLVYLDLSTSFYIVTYDDENNNMKFASQSFWQLSAPDIRTLLRNLTNLEELHMGMVNMGGNGERWCDDIAKSTPKLQVLSLPWCSLAGPICTSFSVMQSLTTVELHYNYLSGSVPEFLATFSNLTVLQLSRNTFDGWFPPTIFQHKKLTTINIINNPGLSGHLPSFSQASSLENDFVSLTNFTGTIPSSISKLKSLRKLDLGASGFSGMLPSSLATLKYLDLLEVSGLQLVGSIPSWISNLTSLTVLWFSNCGLSGQVPSSIGNLRELRKLALYKEDAPQILNLTRLQTLLLHSNNFTGTVEITSFSKLENLSVLNLSNNELLVVDGENSSSVLSFPKINFLSLASCSIFTFPNILKHLNEITCLDLSCNQIQGAIPQWAWETWKGLYFFLLNISRNNFTSLGRDTLLPLHIEYFDLSFNSIEGTIPIPREVNKFTGQVMDPSYTVDGINNCQFRELRIADMASNNFHGTLPEAWFKMLKSMMVMSNNDTLVMENQYYHGQTYQFTATVTYKGNDMTISKILRTLVLLDVSNNAFHGTIPETIGELVLLHGLNTSHNAFTGPIPTQLGRLNELESLDFSLNELSGIPNSYQFSTFSSNSFLGNIGLCGPPLSKQYDNPKEPIEMPYASDKSTDIVLVLFTSVGFGVSFAMTILIVWGRWDVLSPRASVFSSLKRTDGNSQSPASRPSSGLLINKTSNGSWALSKAAKFFHKTH